MGNMYQNIFRNANKKVIISQGPDQDYGAVESENEIV